MTTQTQIKNNTVWTGSEELDLDYLRKLAVSINSLLDLEESEDEDSTALDDARTNVKRRIKGISIDFNIHKEFLDSYTSLN
jgi:hypothetical protein